MTVWGALKVGLGMGAAVAIVGGVVAAIGWAMNLRRRASASRAAEKRAQMAAERERMRRRLSRDSDRQATRDFDSLVDARRKRRNGVEE